MTVTERLAWTEDPVTTLLSGRRGVCVDVLRDGRAFSGSQCLGLG